MSETVNETMNDVTMTDKLTNNDMAVSYTHLTLPTIA